MASLTEDDFSCPVCHEIFRTPVLLSCSHSVCKECLQQFWRTKKTQECPVCRRRSSKSEPPVNLALKNLCESFLKERDSSGSEEICSVHREKLKLFCLEDKQPVCVVCINSQKHDNHKFRPIEEVVSSYKEELDTELKSLQKTLQHNKNVKEEVEKTVQHIKSQAEHTEHQIKQQFEKLHQFLRDEEEATITALREEEEQKKKMMKEKLEEIKRQISALSHTIKDTEEMMKDNDVCFLKEFPVSKERVQISSQPQDPQMPSGAVIHDPRYMSNLPLRVWKKMENMVQNMSERRLVLLGRTGVGKSAAGNTILGRRVFESSMSVLTVTRECSAAHATVSDRPVSVVDTPGLFDTELTQEQTMTRIMKSVELSRPGPHAFLLVFRVGRLTREDQQILQTVKKMFGQEVLKYSIILFTRGDYLEDVSIEEWIKKDSSFSHLVDQCGGRYQVFNNEDESNREQVDDLLQKIDSMIEQNGGGYYSHEMLQIDRGRAEKTTQTWSGKCL